MHFPNVIKKLRSTNGYLCIWEDRYPMAILGVFIVQSSQKRNLIVVKKLVILFVKSINLNIFKINFKKSLKLLDIKKNIFLLSLFELKFIKTNV